MSFLAIFALLFTTAFALASKSSFPAHLKKSHVRYEGTLSTMTQQIPVSGDFYLSYQGNILRILDEANLDWRGKNWVVKHLILVNTDSNVQHAYLTINNKCLSTEFSEDEGTFPKVSSWREIGNNKFEKTFSSRFTLNQVLKNDMTSILGDKADEEHQVRMRLRVTWAKNKIRRAEVTLFVDGEELARKTAEVAEIVPGAVDANVFRVPAICKRSATKDQKKVLDLQMLLLGVSMEEDSQVQDVQDELEGERTSKKERKSDAELSEQKGDEPESEEGESMEGEGKESEGIESEGKESEGKESEGKESEGKESLSDIREKERPQGRQSHKGKSEIVEESQ